MTKQIAAQAPITKPSVQSVPRKHTLLQRFTNSSDFAHRNNHLHRKLAIGSSHDLLERQADRVADQVLIGRASQIQPFTGSTTESAETAPASVDRVLASSGRPLEPNLQQDLGQRFGHDFSRVRVHTGAGAEQSAQDVNAQAYTVGRDIVFGTGQYAPQTNQGRRLLAHELTHVVQNAPILSRQPTSTASTPATTTASTAATPAKPDPAPPTKAESVPLTWTWKDLAIYPLFIDIWKDLALKKITPGDRKLLSLKGTEGAAFNAWSMAVGLAPSTLGGGDRPKNFGDYAKGVYTYADALTGLTPAKDAIMDPFSRIVGLRVDDYLGSDLFLTRLKAHSASVVSLGLLAQGTFSLVQGLIDKNTDPTTLEADPWTAHTGMMKFLVGKIFKEQLTAPNFFDVGPLQLATHPAFAAAPFAGGAVPTGPIFEQNQDVDGKVRERKYGLTLNLPKFLKPGDASATDIGDPAKYRGWQGSAWFNYDSNDPLTVTPDKQLGYKFKGGTIFGYGGHLGELEAGATYGGTTGNELTAWFARGGYGYAAGEKDQGLKKIGFTATFIDWKENYVLAPRGEGGTAAAGWGLKTSPFVGTSFKLGEKHTLDASAALSFVAGQVGDGKTSVGISDFSLGLAYTYLGNSAKDKLPAFKLDLSGSMNRLDWFDPNSPLQWGLQAKGNVGNAFGGVKVMTGAGGIPTPRLDQLGPTVKTMVPSAVIFTGGFAF